MTSRDIEIVEFVKKFRIASTTAIQKIFFPSLSACQKRLKIISDERGLKRIRDTINSQYLYFYKQPKQLKHSLLITEFYAQAFSNCEIVDFRIEPIFGNIRADAFMAYKLNGKGYIALIEIELSHKGFDSNKYYKFFSAEDYKKYFPVMPKIIVVSDTAKLPRINGIDFALIDTRLKNFRL